MKQIFLDNDYEFDYDERDGIHTLYHNHSEYWQQDTRGTVAFQLTDDGDGLILYPLKQKKRLDYSESVYLTILLKLINSDYTFHISDKIEF